MTAGLQTTCGSRMLANFIAPYDAFVVAGLRQRGHRADRQDEHGRVRDGLVERDLVLTARSRTRGIPTYVPGGSSGGSAAAVAARLVPARPAPTPAARSASRRRSPASAA